MVHTFDPPAGRQRGSGDAPRRPGESGHLLRPSGRGIARGLAIAWLLIGGAACDIPTELPRWQTGWTFVALDDTVATQDFLPEGVREVGSFFVVDSLVSEETVRLGDVCEFCTCFSGPIPSVDLDPFDWALPLPGGLTEASLSSGTAEVVLYNEVAFDLLDDGMGNRGVLTVDLFDLRSNVVLDSVRLSEPFPPDDSLRLSFDLRGLELHRNVVARVGGTTPGSGCDDIVLTPEMGIRADVAIRDVRASSVRVVVSDGDVSLQGEQFSIPEFVANRLRPGDARLVLEVEVISSIAITLDLLLSAASRPEDLFTERAALFTPMSIDPGSRAAPTEVAKLFLLDVASVEGAERLHFASRNRVVGDRRVEVAGGEQVRYRATLRAELPNR